MYLLELAVEAFNSLTQSLAAHFTKHANPGFSFHVPSEHRNAAKFADGGKLPAQPGQREKDGQQLERKLTHASSTLRIHLGRVMWKNGVAKKSTRVFKFPEKFSADALLSYPGEDAKALQTELEKEGVFNYELFGCVVHRGVAGSGHYWAFKKVRTDNGGIEWYSVQSYSLPAF
jgi:hypothetical protein